MKRTNLVLNEDLLNEAVKILGAKTYSEAVNLSLQESIKMNKIRKINFFIGSQIWDGSLKEMREDLSARPKKIKK